MAEERTKYKAMIRYMARTAAAGGNPDEVEAKLSPEWLASMAKAMKENPLAPTRLDRRFPNVNQANNCVTALNEYQLCVEKRGKSDLLCAQRGRDYVTICPAKWIEDAKDQMDAGIGMTVGTAFVK